MQATSANPGTTGGNREDLRDDITLLEPQETPFTSMAEKTSQASAMLVETISDRMRAPRTTGAREGGPTGAGNNKSRNRGRFGVYQHFAQDEWSVTHHQQIIARRGGVAGVPNAAERDRTRTELEVKRDIEAVNCSAIETQTGSGGSADMKTRGVFKWLTPAGTALSPEVDNNFRIPSDCVLTHGTASGMLFSEDQLYDLLKAGISVHGKKKGYDLIAGNNVVSTLDHFSRIISSGVVANPATAAFYNVRQGADEMTIRMEVNIYETSFGKLTVIPQQFNQIDSSGVGDPNSAFAMPAEDDLWFLDMLEDLNEAEYWQTATGEGGVIQTTWALLCRSPRGNLVIKES